MTEYQPGNIGDGKVTSDGKIYYNTADGGMMPVEFVKPLDQLKDEVVRKICGHGLDLSRRVSRFLGHTFDDIGGLEALWRRNTGCASEARRAISPSTPSTAASKLTCGCSLASTFGRVADCQGVGR